jgi:hypothetical protein
MIDAEEMEDSGGVEVTKEDSGGFEVTGQKGEPVGVVKKCFQASCSCSWFNVDVCEKILYGALVKAQIIYGIISSHDK